MQKPRMSIIACVGKNRELGKKNELIWRIGADLKRVKALTMGHPIIMGLTTFHSIGIPLPGRTNIRRKRRESNSRVICRPLLTRHCADALPLLFA